MLDNASKVKSEVRLSSYISDHFDVDLKSAGNSKYRCQCPIHGGDNKTAFTIDDAKGLWKCFTGDCGGGSIIDLFMKIHNIDDFGEALEGIAEQNNITLEKSRRSRRITPKRVYNAIEQVAVFAADYLYDHNADDDVAKVYDYAVDRGLNDDIIDDNNIGFFPSGKAGVDFVMKACDDTDALVDGGILKKDDTTSTYWCHLNGRLVFPIRNEQGRYVGFGGRKIDGIKSSGDGKYMNTSNTSVYNKSEVLYGMDRVTSKTTNVVIVEGYLDVIGTNLALGSTDTVALAACGTSLTSNHAKYLKKFSRVTEVFDGDAAGQKAAIKSLDMANQLGNSLHVVLIESDDDPWDIYRDDPKRLINLIHESLPIATRAVQCKAKLLEGNEYDLTEWVKSVIPTLQYSQHRDQIIKDAAYYIGKSAYAFKKSLSIPADFEKHRASKSSENNINKSLRHFCSLIVNMSDEERDGLFATLHSWGELEESVVEEWLPVSTDLERSVVQRLVLGIDAPYSAKVDRVIASMYSDSEENPDIMVMLRGTTKSLLSAITSIRPIPESLSMQISNLRKIVNLSSRREYQITALAYLLDVAVEVQGHIMAGSERQAKAV